MFTLNNKNCLCIVDYHSKFPIIKKAEDLSTDSLILAHKIIFSEYGLLKKIMSDAGSIFVSDRCKQFYKNLNTEQATSSSYYHQSNGPIEVCIKFMKCTFKQCTDTKTVIHIALMQIRATPLEPGLPSTATLLFKHSIEGIMQIIDCQFTKILMMNIIKHQSVDKQEMKRTKKLCFFQ